MAGTPAPKDLYRTLLQRDSDIAKEAAWTTAGGTAMTLQNVVPRRYGPIQAPWPQVRIYVSGARYETTQKYVDHFVTVTFQVWAGPVAAGYTAEYEDHLNCLYVALPYEFECRPTLDSPATSEPLDYLVPDDFARFTENPIGTGGFEIDEGDGSVTRYFGTEFLQSVHLRVPRTRLS